MRVVKVPSLRKLLLPIFVEFDPSLLNVPLPIFVELDPSLWKELLPMLVVVVPSLWKYVLPIFVSLAKHIVDVRVKIAVMNRLLIITTPCLNVTML
jgi:hypothetical protein